MNELFEYLEHIQGLLEQIYTITVNQGIVLLGIESKEEEEEQFLDMVSQMAVYKEEVTSELMASEEAFQSLYDNYKEHITDGEAVKRLQNLVKDILEKKDGVVEEEQKNLMFLQTHSKKKMERVELPQNPKEAASAYKKQQKKT